MISRAIWSEHSPIGKEQRSVGEFFYFKYFSRGGLSRNTLRVDFFSIVELDRSIKRQPIKIKENADTLLEIDAL